MPLQHTHHGLRTRFGFTFIEVIIVMAICFLLCLIVGKAISRAVEHSNQQMHFRGTDVKPAHIHVQHVDDRIIGFTIRQPEFPSDYHIVAIRAALNKANVPRLYDINTGEELHHDITQALNDNLQYNLWTEDHNHPAIAAALAELVDIKLRPATDLYPAELLLSSNPD